MAFHTALNFQKLQVDICEHYREDDCMRGLHGCREGKDMAGDNGNDAEFYKRESKKMLDEIKDLKNLQFIYVYIKRTMKYEKD